MTISDVKVKTHDVVIVGGGFTGLAAAYALAKSGKIVKVLESDSAPGGLAGTFEFSDQVKVEKFYHHWFNNDLFVPELVRQLGLEGNITLHTTKTGMYFNGRIWKLSSPLDVLRFKALPLIDRIRLGLLVIQVRRVKNWKTIEHLSVREWLEPLCGSKVYKLVWEPLLNAKFSVYSEEISAVWMWKKLVLRGSTRNRKGGEQLAYFKGGFGRLSKALVTAIEELGGSVELNSPVISATVVGNRIEMLETDKGSFTAHQFIFTPAFPIIADILKDVADPTWLLKLRRVKYLGNICLVLRLDRSLSSTYWLNVNDPGFPFVGVIEHTNFDSTENYAGHHVVYLSRYVSPEDDVWQLDSEEYFNEAITHLKNMFPALELNWIVDYAICRAEFAQPITEKGYSEYVPSVTTPFSNAWISTMAQIYPEDRGTNYAIREGFSIAQRIIKL